ncbi:large-conductance mechanosensitive channel protein MscL [Candidatus Kaiserbacteria bacterium]|nr:large-conductance mechanosensitive channel protein MscL [Candidatus Kaiserbacteria bacterium]USN92652.1 MAG: large-conductance mechanosensitive channel protein MscL [Candidatus Nomurabacteria bacterium]
MKGFIEEFKAFAVKGNVIDLAVAVVIGAAFGKIVSSLVTNIITPFIGLLMGGIDFTGLEYTIGDEAITYGVFIQSIVDFIIVAMVIFLVVKAINKAQNLGKEEEEEKEKKPTEPAEDIKLLREIRDILKK